MSANTVQVYQIHEIDYLPVKQYPVLTDKGQIYIIETMKHDGSILKFIHATDGGMKDNEPVSYGFELEGI